MEQLLPGLIAHPYHDWKARHPGRRALGYFCTYAPLEVLHAAGFVPVRLMHLPGPVALADAHLPSFSCALARTVSERMLSGELDFLDGVLFVHTCDTMQCTSDIWRMAGPRFTVLNLSLPSVLSNASARSYALAELHRLAKSLEAGFDVRIAGDALRASILLYNEQRRLLTALYGWRDRFSTEQLWWLTLASMVMPVEEYNDLLRSALGEVEGQETKSVTQKGPAVILVGAILDDPAIPRLIQELGGQVVGDDLCTGSRYFDTLVNEREEPFAALADRLLQRSPCPAKYDAAHPPAQRVLELVHRTGAQGVVFVLYKFCDPHAFDYVLLSKALDDAGVPHLLLESDITLPVEQFRTRLQAFLEMLQDLPLRHEDTKK